MINAQKRQRAGRTPAPSAVQFLVFCILELILASPCAASGVYAFNSTNDTLSKFALGNSAGMVVATSSTSSLFGSGIVDLAVDGAGNLYAADPTTGSILKFAPGDSAGMVFASDETSSLIGAGLTTIAARPVPEPNVAVLLLGALVLMQVLLREHARISSNLNSKTSTTVNLPVLEHA